MHTYVMYYIHNHLFMYVVWFFVHCVIGQDEENIQLCNFYFFYFPPFDPFQTLEDNIPSRNLQVEFPLEDHHHIVQVATLAFVIILQVTLALATIMALMLLYCSCFPASPAITEVELPI